MKKWIWIVLAILVIGGFFFYSTYNRLVSREEGVNSAWANVETQYQRRSDLIPNLVSTVKGYAEHERSTLDEVTEARSRATSINLSVDELTPEQLERYQSAQAEVRTALGRLLAVAENYPDLKANANFAQLQSELADTENRISYARMSFNDMVLEYNNAIETFPGSLVAGRKFKPRNGFEAASPDAREAPQVRF